MRYAESQPEHRPRRVKRPRRPRHPSESAIAAAPRIVRCNPRAARRLQGRAGRATIIACGAAQGGRRAVAVAVAVAVVAALAAPAALA